MLQKSARFILLSFALIFVASCGKEPVMQDDFQRKMERLGYTVTQPDNGNATTLVATPYHKNFTVTYTHFANSSSASLSYDKIESDFQSQSGRNRRTSRTDFPNYQAYKLTTGGHYFHVSRIDNTVIYASAKSNYKDEIQKAFKQLDY